MSQECNEFFGKEKCKKRLKNAKCPSEDGLCCSKFMLPLRPVVVQFTEADDNKKTEEEYPMKNETSEADVNRVCAGNSGMCGYAITPNMRACPICGSKHFNAVLVDDAVCIVPSVEMATENPDFRGFAPGHNFKGQSVSFKV